MNVSNVTHIRNLIAGLPPERFYMADYAVDANFDPLRGTPAERLQNECGTAGCICGWVNAVMPGGDREDLTNHGTAALILGLNRTDADELFYALETPKVRTAITHADAVQVLDHLIEHGVVDWSIIQ